MLALDIREGPTRIAAGGSSPAGRETGAGPPASSPGCSACPFAIPTRASRPEGPAWRAGNAVIPAARCFAIPNAITGRSDQVGCILYTPIDRAEARAKAGRPGGHAIQIRGC
jgi:hypothetical protein